VLLPAGSAAAAPVDPHQIVVGFASTSGSAARVATIRAAGGVEAAPATPGARVIRLAAGVSVSSALRRIRHRAGVVWAVPDFVATATSFPVPAGAQSPAAPSPAPVGAGFIPNDPGNAGVVAGWERLQWNFFGPFGVDAPHAWANLAADGRPGGRGVIVAVLDTGVAYAHHGRFVRSPDFYAAQFVRGYDFVAGNPFPDDHNGHGTFVAGTIAEHTNNGTGLTGLAYGARLMPVRVLDSAGNGDASTIAQGVLFAVRHHAQIINLSLEFTSDVTAGSIPDLIAAIAYAHRHHVLVVGAAGNEGSDTIAYPARARYVLAVGAITEHGCLADYSNDGRGLDLVAPGGGSDSDLPNDPDCHPDQPPGGDIYQETYNGNDPRHFGLPPGYVGTSMAVPHVSATAALIIASRVLGPHPTPEAIVARLKATARQIGDTEHYGAGLIDAAAATAPGGPGAVAR
jgi:serine protease